MNQVPSTKARSHFYPFPLPLVLKGEGVRGINGIGPTNQVNPFPVYKTDSQGKMIHDAKYYFVCQGMQHTISAYIKCQLPL